MKPIHPGRILKRELVARNLSANKLALAILGQGIGIRIDVPLRRGVHATHIEHLECLLEFL